MEDKYIPVACHFHDELESFCVKRVKCNITYKDANEEKIVEDFILDITSKNKEEFLVLKNGLKIRLDKITDINGLNPLNYGCDF